MKIHSGIVLALFLIGILALTNIDLVFGYPSESCIAVPHHYQVDSQFCGPACLEMVFDFYGPDVSQYEIADAARTWPTWGTSPEDDMRRAAHFSNLSFSEGPWLPEAFKGYSSRTLGYAAFTKRGMTLDQLRYIIDNGYPLIVNMWYILNPPRYGHYRVAVGYNDTHITFHDPWYGFPYKGPNITVTNSEFLAMWEHEGNWGLFVSPWKVTLSAPCDVQRDAIFTVTATITYPCPDPFSLDKYPASSCNATLILSEGLSLTPSETSRKTIDTGTLFPKDSATVSWMVQANTPGVYSVSVETEGKIIGHVGTLGTYPEYNYEDRIGGASNHSVSVHSISARESIERLAETIETWDLSNGIQTSLTSKLQATSWSLDKENQNAIIGQLAAFMNEAEALRSKKLTSEQADHLAAEAQRIIDLIQG